MLRTRRKRSSPNMARVQAKLFINPRHDVEFVERVTSEAALATSPDDLRARLSTHYPNAIVRRRSLEGERAEIWYVYRDGHWVAE